MPNIDSLIYDRTSTDIANKTTKGLWNYTDMNRVESWCQYLATELTSYNYPVTITTKTNWARSSKRTSADMERVRSNIKKLKDAFYSFTNIYSNAEDFDYLKANNWEKILHEIDELYEKMKAEFLYSGTFYSGESEGLF